MTKTRCYVSSVNHFLPFPMVFTHLFLGVSTTSSDASPWCFYNFLHASPWCFYNFLGCFSLLFLQLPRMLLLGVSTTSSDASPWCFYNFLECFSLVFLQIPQMLLLFPLSIPPVSYLF